MTVLFPLESFPASYYTGNAINLKESEVQTMTAMNGKNIRKNGTATSVSAF